MVPALRRRSTQSTLRALMSFFGLFGKRSPESTIQKHAGRVSNKRTQGPDRWESIQALGALKTPEAVAALLPRFTYYSDPSITDGEEKDEAYRLILDAKESAIEPVVVFLQKAESLSWPLKILDRVATADRVVTELLGLLTRMDTEYERDPQRKLQVLQSLEERIDDRITGAVSRFLGDVNETVRFHAVEAIFAQRAPDGARAELQAALAKEGSVRVRTKLLERFAALKWDVGDAREKLAKVLPPGFSLDAAGVPLQKK
jgi:HEAT repeat protein